MHIKATTLGQARPSQGDPEAFLRPTALTSFGQPPLTNTRFSPTAFSPAPEQRSGPLPAPSVLLVPASQPAPVPVKAASASPKALPGKPLTLLNPSTEALMAKVPGLSPRQAERAIQVLMGLALDDVNSAYLIAFGAEAQELAAKQIKTRLGLMESSATRGITQHLIRLKSLMSEVLAAFDGGLFKRAPHKVWSDVRAEVAQIETLLDTGRKQLVEVLEGLNGLKSETIRARQQVTAYATAADYLSQEPAVSKNTEQGALLLARATALRTSQALLVSQEQSLEMDVMQTHALLAMVQDGVLLHLPAVQSHMANLGSSVSDTQKFVFKETLTDFLHHLKT